MTRRSNGESILLFIPCYNCAPQIGRVLAQIRGELANFITEVLVLDNGSRDGTVEAALTAAKNVPLPIKVARNRENYSLGGSHKAAFAHADERGFSHVVILHGDDQGDLADLLPILESGDHRRFDACMGARFARDSKLTNYSAFRIAGNLLYNFLFSIAAGRPVRDLGSGLNVLARTVFANEKLSRLPDDLQFNAWLLLDMFDNDLAVQFFPISWREDDQASNVKLVTQALETLRAPLFYRFARQTFRKRDLRAKIRSSYAFDIAS